MVTKPPHAVTGTHAEERQARRDIVFQHPRDALETLIQQFESVVGRGRGGEGDPTAGGARGGCTSTSC